MPKDLRSIGELLIPVIAYGDSAGLAGENQSAEEIAMNFGWIDTLRSPTNREIFQVEPLGRLGEWSDDTQLTLAVANGIIQAGGFDIDAQVKHLIQAHDASPHVRYFDNRNLGGRLMPRGWGYNTTDSVLRLKEGVSPSESGGKNATCLPAACPEYTF
jgi:ADP-ribosylglycohydrolase